ncbi:uncharacterized protein CDAR_414921 [Caerostris darwini]|uniref:Uncharacterized protein n=1 Tax=Caerostris darwini TaxID=1538125 RepID=A0AAV4NIT2_9ARAC|nr:uncharacterized protein CDAR_414921 [Caerostris darwini]
MRTHSPETLSYASEEECILVLIETGEKTALGKDLQHAYLTWQKLSPSFRRELNTRMQSCFKSTGQKELYECLIRGFDIWDYTQNLDGAPGWSIKESSINQVLKHKGEDLMNLLHLMDETCVNHKKSSPVTSLAKFDRCSSVSPCDEGTGDQAISFRPRREEHSSMRRSSKEGNGNDMSSTPKPFSKEKMMEKLRKVQFKEKYDRVDKVSSRISYEHLENRPQEGDVDSLRLEDLSLDEEVHLRNLRISDCREDSDFEKKISPLISDDEN